MKKPNYVLIVCDQMDCYMIAVAFASLDKCMKTRDKFEDNGYKVSIYKGETFINNYLYDHALSTRDVNNFIRCLYEGMILKDDIA